MFSRGVLGGNFISSRENTVVVVDLFVVLFSLLELSFLREHLATRDNLIATVDVDKAKDSCFVVELFSML